MPNPAPATTPSPTIDPQLVANAIDRAVENVCATMLGHKVDCLGVIAGTGNGPVPGEQIVGSVGFVGDINGIIYLRLPLEFARFATAETLGMTPAEVAAEGDDLLKDSIGELTNMTVGGFKNVLCDRGHPCMLTLPTIIRASQLCTGTSRSAQRAVYHYDCKGHRFTADIQVRHD